MLRKIGMRAHDYGKASIEELAEKIRQDGYDTIQFALKKALAGVEEIEDGLSQEIGNQVHHELLKKDLDISVLGAYLNYGTLDEVARTKNVQIFNKHLELAHNFGARMVGTETGSLNIDYKAHMENHGQKAFDRLRLSLEKMLEKACEYRALMAIEPVAHHILHTPTRLKDMIQVLRDDHVKVIFDPVNIITEENYGSQDYLMEQMFDLLGDRILVVHGKDFIIDKGEKIIVSPGKGLLNYTLLTNLIKQSDCQIDLLAENNPVGELVRVHDFYHSFFS